ncbi:MAG TPA: HAMP domain-containing sensor histidine kinase [Candidatus Dormibacteraeota bacterium]
MTLTLRTRLLLGMGALAVMALLIAGSVTYYALQDFLLKRVDQDLKDAHPTVISLLSGSGPPRGGGLSVHLASGTFAELRAPDGKTLIANPVLFTNSDRNAPLPTLPSKVSPTAPEQPVYSTISESGSLGPYRVMVMTVDNPGLSGDILLIAEPLGEVQGTLQQLLLIELGVGGAAVLATILLGWWFIRSGLSPLERMGETADAIAAGDLSRRVEQANPRTEIGRLGLALNHMLAQIEHAFAERTESEQRLRRFIADASHELRTPLTSIRGYAELMRGGARRSAEDSTLARRRIEEEAVRMTVLVDDLLLLARLDQGRPLERRPVDLAQIARDTGSDARAVAPTREIKIDVNGPVIVNGDDMRLRQVVSNLVRNAIVHTPPAAPIEVSTAATEREAVLTVTDHGPGIPGEQVRQIFEPFYRADPGRSRDRGGSGLGLSIVSAVVAAHQGSVEVVPTDGGGATFRVRLPLAAA